MNFLTLLSSPFFFFFELVNLGAHFLQKLFYLFTSMTSYVEVLGGNLLTQKKKAEKRKPLFLLTSHHVINHRYIVVLSIIGLYSLSLSQLFFECFYLQIMFIVCCNFFFFFFISFWRAFSLPMHVRDDECVGYIFFFFFCFVFFILFKKKKKRTRFVSFFRLPFAETRYKKKKKKKAFLV